MELLNNFLTVEEALPSLRINSIQTFYTLNRRGQLPDKLVVKQGGKLLIRKNILEQYQLGNIA